MESTPPDPAGAARGPLHGIRVLDLSAYIAGPYACTLLADQGADVLKIEPPGGDNLRQYPSTLPTESRAFLGVNRSKRGMVLDLKDPADHAVLLRLVRDADVLVHNFRPSVPRRLGIDFDQLGKDQDLKLALMYGIDATASLIPDEGRPETGVSYTGAGDRWTRPIVVRGQAADLSTIANAYRYIAERYPGSRVASSTLYAGPPPNFVTRIEFDSRQGDQALYFDLTDWAAAWHREVPN